MKKIAIGGGVLALAAVSAAAQTHVVHHPDTVVRAVAVYEWTGELGKPTASRLVPVSLFINSSYEDAGVYLARPVPFALETGTVFELEKAGTDQGTLELAFARKLETAENAPGLHADEGWFAYGAYKAKPVEKPAPALKAGALPAVVASGGNRPHFSNKPDDAAAKPVDRSSAAGAGTTVSAGKADEPTLKTTPASDSDSAKDDPDRPTLKRRSPEERKAAQKKAQTAAVVGTGDLNDDPDRPSLHRGKPTGRLEDDDVPALHGVPQEMHQLVAVSDAKNRPEHEFARPWESPEEREGVLTAMRALAAKALPGAPAPVPPAAPRAAARRRTAKPAVVLPAVSAPSFDSKSEALSGYTLSYGGAATYVYSAATPDAADPVLVTVVAQREPDGSLKAALTNVTDAAHLDRTPQLRLVDAVDPDASNRASLLFERRGATTRDFALYRVIGAQAEQTIAAY